MTRRTIDIDDKVLEAAAEQLGTTTRVETVNAALVFAANRSKRAQAFEDPLMWGTPELADPEVRAHARC
jgi:Arc/MetJ family transcription regulator